MRVSESDAVIETASYINDLVSTLEIDLDWIERDTYWSILEAELAKHIPAPGEDLTLSS